jgi:hypothetical protein
MDSPSLQEETFSDEQGYQKLVAWYIIINPILWIMGLQVIFGLGLLLILLFRYKGYKSLFNVIFLSWVLIALAQALSVTFNWLESGSGLGTLFKRLISTHVTGWIFLGLTLSLGGTFRLNSDRIVRAFCILGLSFILFGLMAFVMFKMVPLPVLKFKTPVGYLFPEHLSFTEYVLTLRFFRTDDMFGFSFPRLSLFAPWAVITGFLSVSVFFISLNEKNHIWRFIGAAGSFFVLFASLSRASWVAFILCLGLYILLKIHRPFRWLLVTLASLIAIPMIILNLSPGDLVDTVYDFLMGMRAGSSSARELGMQLSWEGFLASPVIGHGWPGDFIHENIPMPIGSHSTVYGVLYTGGLMTFSFLVLAASITLIKFLNKGEHGSGVNKSALFSFFTLAILCYGEGIYSFVMPGIFIFFWIGASLFSSPEQKSPLKEGLSL